MNKKTANKPQQIPMSEEACELALKLLEAAKTAAINKLEKSETDFLKKNKMPMAKFYKKVATIDLAHHDNPFFHQGIMLLVDALTHTQENHPEILVAGEDEENAEVQLVALEMDTLAKIPYAETKKFLLEARKKIKGN